MAEVGLEAKVITQAFNEIFGGSGALGGGFFNIALAKPKIDELKTLLKNYIPFGQGLALTMKEKSLKDAFSFLLTVVQTQEELSLDAWSAGLGMGMGGSLSGAYEKLIGTSQLLGVVKGNIMQQGIAPLVQRYLASEFTPNIPDTRLAFQMVMHDQLSRKEFNEYALLQGWATKWHDKLYDVFTAHPNIYLAFLMYTRGLIDKTKLYSYFKLNGFDASLHPKLESALGRRPTFRELTSLSDYVPLPDMWVSEVLRANGYLETDLTYLTTALRLRPLREETRSVIGRYLWEYQIGRIDRDTLIEKLTPLCQNPKELELNVLWGDLRVADELLDEEIEVLEARVQYGDPTMQTQDAIFTELVALGITEEKANLMAELWYYKYVYTPT